MDGRSRGLQQTADQKNAAMSGDRKNERSNERTEKTDVRTEGTGAEGAKGAEGAEASASGDVRPQHFVSPGLMEDLVVGSLDGCASDERIPIVDVHDMMKMTLRCIYEHMKDTGRLSVAVTQAKDDSWHRKMDACGYKKTRHETHQWMISGYGRDHVSNSEAFNGVCRHNPVCGDVLAIPDVTADPRTADSLYIESGLRAYCGIRLTSLPECTVCVMWLGDLPRPSALEKAEVVLTDLIDLMDAMVTTMVRRMHLARALSVAENKVDQQEKQTRYVSHEIINQLGPLVALTEQEGFVDHGLVSNSLSTVISILRNPVETALRVVATPSFVSARAWFSKLETFSQQVVRNPKVKFTSVLNIDTPGDDATIYIDVTKLRQAVVNVLLNANKFTDEGAIEWSMRVSPCTSDTVSPDEVSPDEVMVELVLADTGCGIRPDDISRVTEMFVQVGAPESRLLGSGIGLSIAKAAVEIAHSGKLSIESTVGKGTTVTIALKCPCQPHRTSE